MYKIKEFLSLLEEYAPLSYSHRLVERGDYDNSGIIVENHDKINKAALSETKNTISFENKHVKVTIDKKGGKVSELINLETEITRIIGIR